jgi:hypothetical protein
MGNDWFKPAILNLVVFAYLQIKDNAKLVPFSVPPATALRTASLSYVITHRIERVIN